MENTLNYEIEKIQPSQIYISELKYQIVSSKLEKSSNPHLLYEPVAVRRFKRDLVFLDGHSRALWLYRNGIRKIKVFFEFEEYDWNCYEKCIDLCKSLGIFSISDLDDRIVNHEFFIEKWITYCENLRK